MFKSPVVSTLFLITMFAIPAYTQELEYNKHFVECEDKWVAFEANKEGKHPFGLIYLDAMAGLTFEYTGNFIIGSDGKFISDKLMDSLNGKYKVRLKPNDVKVALIPVSKLRELGVEESPEWLSIYHSYSDTAGRLQRWGYYYNDFGMSEKALLFLEPGYKMNSDYKGMAVELAFAYNALEQYEKAVPVLKKAIELNPQDGYMYKELSYALLKTGKLEEASVAAEKGIEVHKDISMKAEIAYNMAYSFFLMKDKENFSSWAKETRKWTKPNDQLGSSINAMEKKMN